MPITKEIPPGHRTSGEIAKDAKCHPNTVNRAAIDNTFPNAFRFNGKHWAIPDSPELERWIWTKRLKKLAKGYEQDSIECPSSSAISTFVKYLNSLKSLGGDQCFNGLPPVVLKHIAHSLYPAERALREFYDSRDSADIPSIGTLRKKKAAEAVKNPDAGFKTTSSKIRRLTRQLHDIESNGGPFHVRSEAWLITRRQECKELYNILKRLFDDD